MPIAVTPGQSRVITHTLFITPITSGTNNIVPHFTHRLIFLNKLRICARSCYLCRPKNRSMKRIYATLLFTLLFSAYAISQVITLKGQVLDANSGLAVEAVEVTVGAAVTYTAADGSFELAVKADGQNLQVNFKAPGYRDNTLTILPTANKEMDLGSILLTPEALDLNQITGEDRIPVITLPEGEDEGDIESENISGILSASRDPFISAAAFNLSNGGFDIRGYRNETEVFFNGMPVTNLDNDAVYWSVWGGLNDVTRNRESTIDLSANAYSFGGLGGVTAFDTRASEQRKQRRFSYLFSNRSYSHRWMGTWSTGMQPSGWAFSFSGSRRLAKEGYVPGTFYDAWAWFASVDRKLGKRHLLNLTTLGAPVRRGQQGAGTEEVNDLAGTNFYNPNWGYQQGKKRNARVIDAHQPLVILRHDWQMTENASLITTVGTQFGRYGRSGIDWFNAPDPRADYYRKLPSYFALESSAVADELTALYQNNPDLLQIQWDQLYEANAMNGQSWEDTPGIWSQYVIANNRSDTRKINANTVYQNVVSDHLTLNFGVQYQNESTHYFRELTDLLGGDYYVNLNRFALEEGFDIDFAKNNLNDPEVVVREGDTYGWDYDINARKNGYWLQGQFSYRKIDFFATGSFSKTTFWREGKYRTGRFPDSSYGESEKQEFSNVGIKGGMTFKIDGRNYLYGNLAFITRPPNPRDAYASPRQRDQLVPGLTNEKVYAAEGGYQLRSPSVKARATFFYAQINDALKINRFFLPGDISNFGTYILTGLDRRHAGVELALSAKLSPTLTLNGAASIGEYIYTSRPNGIFIQDDDGIIQDRGTIYIKNFYVPGTPQTAASLGLDYRSPNYWSASITVNFFDRNYIDFSPERRTADQVFGLEQGSEFYNQIVNQTRVPDRFTVDLFAYKSFRINRNTFFYLTGGVTNLLNAEVITGGYEQLRFERQDVERTGLNVFGPRYFYAYGTNFFVMGAVRF